MVTIKDGKAIILLPEKTTEVCTKFANKVIGSNVDCYSGRGQENVTLIRDQIAQGKIAECAVAKFYHCLGFPISMPDFDVYDSYDKSYGADLILCEEVKLHVKSVSREVANKFGVSFIFQKEDPLFQGKVQNDWISLCQVNSNNSVIYFGCLHPLIANFGPLKKKSLNSTKTALYLRDQEDDALSFVPTA